MSGSLLGLWILVGICPPWPPWPPWPPPPWPWWRFRIASIVGAVIGGWAYTQVFPLAGEVTALGAAATALGAYLGAAVLTIIVGLVAPSREQR